MLKRLWRWMFRNNIPAAPLLKASDEHNGPVYLHGGFDTMDGEE